MSDIAQHKSDCAIYYHENCDCKQRPNAAPNPTDDVLAVFPGTTHWLNHWEGEEYQVLLERNALCALLLEHESAWSKAEPHSEYGWGALNTYKRLVAEARARITAIREGR